MLYPLLVSKRENARILDNIIKNHSDDIAQPRKLTAESWSVADIIKNLRNYPLVDTFVLDLSAIKEKDDELISMLDGLKLQRASARVVIFAEDYANGDELLDKLVRSCYTNIAAKSKDITDDKKQMERMLEDIEECLSESGLPKSKYTAYVIRREPPEKAENATKIDVIPKMEEEPEVVRELLFSNFCGHITFVGAMPRIGTTAAALSSAFYFAKRGAKVAYINEDVVALTSYCVANAGGICSGNGSFDYNGVYFTSSADSINNNYNIVITDAGVIDTSKSYTTGFVYLVAGISFNEIDATRDAEYQLDGDNGGYRVLINFATEEQYQQQLEKLPNPDVEYHILPYMPDKFDIDNFAINHLNSIYEIFADNEEAEQENY